MKTHLFRGRSGIISIIIGNMILAGLLIPSCSIGYNYIEPENLNQKNPTRANNAIIYVGGTGSENYTNIQDAVDCANFGDTIFVYNGTYLENVMINNTIKLIGENSRSTIIDGGNLGDVIKVTRENVTIAGFSITRGGSVSYYTDYASGIKLTNAKNCKIMNNNFYKNNIGIFLDDSFFTNIRYNNVSEGYHGILLESSSYNNLELNNFSFNQGHSLKFDSSNNNIIEENTVNNHNIYQEGDAIHFTNSSNNSIIKNILRENSNCINIMFSSNNNKIVDNNISNNIWGFYLSTFSNQNVILNNTLSENNINVIESSKNIIKNNRFISTRNKITLGLLLDKASNNEIVNNSFENSSIRLWGEQLSHFNSNNIPKSNLVNDNPIYFYNNQINVQLDGERIGQLIIVNCSYFTVKNLAINNTTCGITIAYSKKVIITQNIISDNKIGIRCKNLSDSYFVNNNFTLCSQEGIYLTDSSFNKIYHNNFINKHGYVGVVQSYNNTFYDSYPIGGNYWSNYEGEDFLGGPNQTISGSDEIGDSPYYLVSANTNDIYPLMKPFHQVIVIFENDTDIDSMPDDWGKKYNFNFSDPNDSNKDTDDDNLTNFEEYLNNTDPTNQDSDNDSLTDGDEIKIYFTNPLILDTDGDNYNDNIEIDNGTNPLDETDYPDEDTPNPEENNERKSQEKEYTVFIILGVIIVIILIILGIFMNFKMKKEK